MAGFFMRGRMGGMKQFSLRDLLFLVVIVALALGWWLDRRPIPARFQMVSSPNGTTYILDTGTGQAWYNNQSEFLPPKPTGE
jgi:hypothetical protein